LIIEEFFEQQGQTFFSKFLMQNKFFEQKICKIKKNAYLCNP